MKKVQDTMEYHQGTNVHISGVSKYCRRRKERKLLWRNNARNFSNLGKVLDIQSQESQLSSVRLNSKKSSPRHILIKLSNVKNQNLESIKRRATCCILERLHIALSGLLSRPLACQKGEKCCIFIKVLKEENCQPRI